MKRPPQARYVSQQNFGLSPNAWMAFAEQGDLVHLTDNDGIIRAIICIPQDDICADEKPKPTAKPAKKRGRK